MRAFQKFDPQAIAQALSSPSRLLNLLKLLNGSRARALAALATLAGPPRPTRDSWSAADWQAYFEERAAIREYDGGLVEDLKPNASPSRTRSLVGFPPIRLPASSDERCLHCGVGHRSDDELLPVLASGGHVWVHNACWTDWYGLRRREAAAALNAIGLVLPASGGDQP